jgi:hypothetical protein
MLNFSVQYNIAQGIFLAFKNNVKKKQLSVSHPEEVRNRYKYSFPTKYQTYTKENFISLCLYICFKKSPSSFNRFLELINRVEFKDVLLFKNTIINYRHFLAEDTNFINSNYGSGSVITLFKEYNKGKIQWYTLWFYLKYSNYDIVGLSHIQKVQINRIKTLLLYVTFSETSLSFVKTLFNESTLLAEG